MVQRGLVGLPGGITWKFPALELPAAGPRAFMGPQPSMPTPCAAPGAPVVNYEGSFIFAGSAPGEETCFFMQRQHSCVKSTMESFLFYLNELQRSTYGLQAKGGDSWNMNL